MTKRLPLLYFLCSLLLVTFITSCAITSDSKNSVAIEGSVSKTNGDPIAGAIVEITQPASLQASTNTDSLGNFSLTVDVKEATQVTISVDKAGYISKNTSFKITGGVDVTGLSIELASEDEGTGGDGGDQVGGEPAGAAAIILKSIPTQAINIAETGDVVNATFTFEVQDSAGRPLNQNGAVDVNFTILSGPGGGETMNPIKVRTNSDGKATTSLFSGNKAGPVKIQASVERPEYGITIKSTPVLVAIHGGFPDPGHFSLTANRLNFAGWDLNNVRNTISVIVGDEFSNPVKPGTVVYFSTSGGIIQGSGATDDDGIVTVDLISNNPRPTDAIAGGGGRPGYATVTAHTVDENNVEITKQIYVLFSGTAPVITGSPSTFDLPPNGGQNFNITVTDVNGNPMPAGTVISINAGEAMEISPKSSFTVPSTLFPGSGVTDFSFSIRDTDDQNSDAAPLSVSVTVKPPVGEETTMTISQGTRRKTR